ncbi:MAG TPA: carboxypeptidase-like regulatory domain-containing protein [Smithella sp.]|nr:carboxypeptidase-like regulatory domain-containing protein [Smithella sp.]
MRKTLVWLFILMVAVIIGGCSSGSDDPTYSVKGAIVDDNGSAVAGATVTLSDDSGASGAVAAGAAVVETTTTDANGSYTFAGIDPGNYTITPAKAGYVFVPENLAVTVSNADVDLSTDDTKIFAARKDNTDDAVQTASGFLHYTLPDQYQYEQDGKPIANEAAALFSGYTLTDGIDYGKGTTVSGYALDQFVDKADVNAKTPDPDGALGSGDARKLYSAVIRSKQDGFSNRTKFIGQGYYNADLTWDQFVLGYLLDLNYSGRAFYPGSVAEPPTQVKMYNVKYAYDIYMFRKIDVKRPDADGTIATFEIAATTDNAVDDATYTTSSGLTTTKFTVAKKSFGAYTDVKVIPLTQFLTDYVTDVPGNYTYKIVALDDTKSQTGWTYAAMQQAYYLPDYDFIIQVDASGSVVAGTKINFPVRIELISAAAVEYDYDAKNPPAYAKAYDE